MQSKFPSSVNFLLGGGEMGSLIRNFDWHHSPLGDPEGWPKLWSTIQPLIDQVLSGGKSTWSENQLIPVYRNGHIETAYWTFCYRDSGQIGGVLVICQETTEKVIEHQKLQLSEARFRTIFEQAPMGIAILSGRNMTIELANGPMYEIWGKDESIIGMTLLEAQPELEGQRFIELLEAVYDSERPTLAMANGPG